MEDTCRKRCSFMIETPFRWYVRTNTSLQTIDSHIWSAGLKVLFQFQNFEEAIPNLQTGPPPYNCSKCNATFVQRHNYVNHEGRHLGLYRYSCPLCPKGFSKTVHLKSHLATKHGQDGFKFACPVCGKTYARKDVVNTHMMNVHGIGVDAEKDGAKHWMFFGWTNILVNLMTVYERSADFYQFMDSHWWIVWRLYMEDVLDYVGLLGSQNVYNGTLLLSKEKNSVRMSLFKTPE